MPTFIFDDIYGDLRPGAQAQVPIYLPPTDQWDPLGGTCPQCTLKTNLPIPIDPKHAQNGTWHTVTVNPGEPVTTLSITFVGTGITAYCMLPPFFSQIITSYMNMTFELDGKIMGSYEKTATTTQWTYNYPVYNITGLENGEHTFVIQPQGGATSSYMVFDYFAYEFEEPPTASTSSATFQISPSSTQSTASVPSSILSQTTPAISQHDPMSGFPGATSEPHSGISQASGAIMSQSQSTPAPEATSAGISQHVSHNISAGSKAAIIVCSAFALAALMISLLYGRRQIIRRKIKRRNAIMRYQQDIRRYRARSPQAQSMTMASPESYYIPSIPPSSREPGWTTSPSPVPTDIVTHGDASMPGEPGSLQAGSEVTSGYDQQLRAVYVQVENLIVDLRRLGVGWSGRAGDLGEAIHSDPLPSYQETVGNSTSSRSGPV